MKVDFLIDWGSEKRTFKKRRENRGKKNSKRNQKKVRNQSAEVNMKKKKKRIIYAAGFCVNCLINWDVKNKQIHIFPAGMCAG